MIRFAVVTLSDRAARGEREDASGPLVKRLLEEEAGGVCAGALVLPDDQERIEDALRTLADESGCDLIVTTGGTGMAPRDVTPEATRAVIHREAPGLAEAMRAAGLAKTPFAMLSRAVCGMRGRTLIVNLSGSPEAVAEQLETLLPVLPHAIRTLRGSVGDCAEDIEKNGDAPQ